MPRWHLTLRERFDSKWVPADESDCWTWIAGLDAHGYGIFFYDGHSRGAHRAAYELYVGPIPVGLYIDHLCRNPACVNPGHLEPVTHAENVRRGERAQRTHCVRGHEFTPDNTYTHPTRGKRRCKTCHRERELARKRRQREMQVAA